MRNTVVVLGLPVLCAFPFLADAQATLVGDTITMQKARVTAVLGEQTSTIPGTDTPAQSQTLTALILDGPENGTSVTFPNDYIQLKVGDVFYLRHITNAIDDTNFYTVADPYRLPIL